MQACGPLPTTTLRRRSTQPVLSAPPASARYPRAAWPAEADAPRVGTEDCRASSRAGWQPRARRRAQRLRAWSDPACLAWFADYGRRRSAISKAPSPPARPKAWLGQQEEVRVPRSEIGVPPVVPSYFSRFARMRYHEPLTMQRITRDKLTPVFDRRVPPVARVVPGEVFLVETEDSRGGRTRVPEHTTPEYLVAMRKRGYHGNPVTGPIWVEGARPGDLLAIHILEQRCDALGYMGYWPFLFHLEDYFPQPATVLVDIREGQVHFAEDIRIPVRPVIGTIGVAPALEAIACGSMGRHCGNVDVQEIAAGSILYLPVYTEGALLCLGDCHAIQSDGEIGSVEMRSEVTLRCELLPGCGASVIWPRIETSDSLVTVGIATP